MLDLGTLQLGVKVDGAAAKAELGQIGTSVEQTGSKTQQLAAKAKAMIKAFVAAYAIRELIKLGKAALDAYAQFEQLEGGVKKIFGKEASKEVMKNAEQAYKTAGMSANKYMDTVTSFSASLISSMGGNTKAAAKVADMAIRDMSDNANTFGTNMKSIQDAYQGFAKQNYSMLDNLKLGYGGSRAEMERLLKDAEKLTGKKYDISNLNDVYEAIHAIQKEYNITGTTAKEASKTVEGSINMVKASFENLLTAIGGGKGVSKATGRFLAAVGTMAKNVAPIALNILRGLVEGLVKAVPKVIGMIGKFMDKLAENIEKGGKGNMMEVAGNLLKQLAIGLAKNIPELVKGAIHLVIALAKALIDAAPKLVSAGVEAAKNFAQGFLEDHPIIEKAVTAIGTIFKVALAPAIAIIKLVTKVWKTLMGQKGKKKFKVETPFAKSIKTIVEIFGKWGNVLKQKAEKTYHALKDGFSSVLGGMKDLYEKWKDILSQKAKKTWKAAKSGFETVLNAMKSLWSKWQDILNQSSTKTFTTNRVTRYQSEGKPPGKRIGLREVPYDGYSAILHKGEAVMTAAEVNKLKRSGESSVTEKGNLTVNVYGSNNMDVNELAAAVERRIINIQKRRTAAWA